MSFQLLAIGNAFAAIALIGWAFVSLLTGSAVATGESVRTSLQPTLADIRSRTTLRRDELADRTVMAAVIVAMGASLVERSIVLMILGALLFLARPQIRKLTKEENRLRAIVGSLSLDLVIGLYLPLILAQVITRNWGNAAVLFLTTVALSWPAGGGGARRADCRPAWNAV